MLRQEPVSNLRRARLMEVGLVSVQVRAQTQGDADELQLELGWVVAKRCRLAAAGWGIFGLARHGPHSEKEPIGSHGSHPLQLPTRTGT